MKKTLGFVAALGMLLGVGLVGPAGADGLTSAQQARKAACESIDPGPNVVTTYTAGSGAAGANDTCVVVSTSTSLKESIEQVNNPRAAKAVVRVVQTEESTTTTQAYRWDNRGVPAGGQRWVAEGDPITVEELEILAECMQTPGKDFCA